MGTSVKIGGYQFPLQTWQVSEDSTPLAANDTTGSTGVLTASILAPDPYLLDGIANTGAKWLLTYGHNILQDKTVELVDTRFGTITGVVSTVSKPTPGTISISANVSLNRLNAYNVAAKPFSGTLGNLIRYYVGLAYPGASVSVDLPFNTRPIAAPGWTGELWYYLKMLAVAHEFEIACVNGVLTFRKLRQREFTKGLDITRGADSPVPNLAQTIEVYRYENQSINEELVYPVGGWSPETEVLNVNAGEKAEYTLQLSASVSSIQAPTLLTSVSPDYDASSVYTIVANDGFPVSSAQWTGSGGQVKVYINEDTTSLRVVLRGATRVPLATGGFASNFSLALASDTSGSRYSTLRIVGTGVKFNKVKSTIRTGATAAQTGTVVGQTIDNPFLSSKDQQYRAGTKAASQFAVPIPTRGGQVTNAVTALGATFGNVGGTRITDVETKRPYRIRTSQIGPATVTYSAEDDLLHDDIEAFRTGKTYAQIQTARNGMTYLDDYLMGLR